MRWQSLLEKHGAKIALPAGASMPLAFAPFGYFLVAPVGLAVLFLLWEDSKPASAARRGFLFGAGMFLAGTYWTYVSVHSFGKAPAILAGFLMLALVAILAGYVALTGYVARRWAAGPDWCRWLIVLPGTWVLLEWVRGWAFSGFPWLSLGYSQIDGPLAGLAPITGVFGLSWGVALTAGALCALIAGRRVSRVIAAAVVMFLWLGSGLIGLITWTDPTGERVRVSLIQGGVSQDLKWLPEQRQPTLDLYRDLTRLSYDSDLVVWPEAAIPVLMHQASDYLNQVGADAARNDSEVMTGLIMRDPANGQLKNTLVVLGPEPGIYAKRHLVPFGEYFPVPDFVRERMKLMNLPYTDFTAGGKDQSLLFAAGQKIAPSICYEDIFGAEQIGFLPGATLLVNVSNDAWFGESIAPHQHLEIARMRALETGRYLLRATNNGITAIIGPRGTLEQTSPQFQTHVLSGEVEPHTGTTPYVRHGNWLIVIAAGIMLLAGVLTRRN